ncbi:MAG: molybdopterin-dependent oxidoreductase [Acidobacteriaceae bacterium]|nr:molybdopterin-dependent oxidoreductase [Acidobacteriaceae bacterium]
MIIRQKEPVNLETPMDQVHLFLTPAELFYVRNHFSAPTLEADSYQLRVEGAVRAPFALTLQQLRNLPAETRVATLE